jgi:uncharacterized protein (DUF433 family)
MAKRITYHYLEGRPNSQYRQLWIKGRHIRAEVLYRCTVGVEARTPEEVAQDYDLPVAAVREAIDYAVHSQELLQAERTREDEREKDLGLDKPPFVPTQTSTAV